METQKQEKSGRYHGNYQGYSSSEEEKDTHKDKVMERDMSLLEYDLDKDYILESIKQNLKNRDYDSAQELVHKFRAAAKGDEQFEILARRTADGINRQKDLQRVKTSLDMTPEDDYEVRLSLSERMYKLIPSEENLARINQYRKALHKAPIASDAAMSEANARLPAATKAVRSGVNIAARVCCFSFALWMILFWGIMHAAIGFSVLHPATFAAGLAFIVHLVSYLRLKMKEGTSIRGGGILAQNIGIGFLATVLILVFAISL